MIDFRCPTGIFEIVMAFVIIISTKIVTADAGVSCAPRMWLGARRLVFFLVAAAIFARGTGRFDINIMGDERVTWFDALEEAVVVSGFMVFQVMKSIQLITRGRVFASFPSLMDLKVPHPIWHR